MSETGEFIANLIASVLGGGLIGGLVAWRRSKSQNDLDLSKAWREFTTPLIERLDKLDGKVKVLEAGRETLLAKIVELEVVIAAYKNWAKRLVEQLLDNGIDPEPFDRRKEEREQ